MQGFLNILKFKSKTVNFAAATTALVALLRALGVEMDPAIIASIMTLLAVALRLVTNKPMDQK